MYKKHEEAIRLVGKLDGITRLLPDKDFFLLMFIKKDAAYSSQIEGTKATLQDAVAAPVTEEKARMHPDVDDITHYVEAVNYGIERTKTLPISLRLIKEIHERLMTGARATSMPIQESFVVVKTGSAENRHRMHLSYLQRQAICKILWTTWKNLFTQKTTCLL